MQGGNNSISSPSDSEMHSLMKSFEKLYIFFALITWLLLATGCSRDISENSVALDRKPVLEPDYTDVTIPPNIAPMNFIIKEEGSAFTLVATSDKTGNTIKINSSDGEFRFGQRSWKKLLSESRGDTIRFQVYSSQKAEKSSKKYSSFFMAVSDDPVDPWLAYRLINPGYYSWSNIKIVQRSVESFREKSVVENQVIEKNCINCHSFNNNSPDRFMIHMRGSRGGTYFVEDGKITRTEPKIDAMPGGATYPSWHPGGQYVAFSSNQVRQSFYSQPERTIEVFDLVSSLVLYDRKTNETISITDSDTTKYLLTFPSWSPDGRYLYFCRALQVINSSDPELEQIKNTHYNLARKSFDPLTRKFGETELVYDAAAIKKSASFPRISPDGKTLVFTLHDYGTFPIWHREADLYSLDLNNGNAEKMNINSDETESYHSWSSNGRWLAFSSKRVDGRSARPYFAHIDSAGKQGKE
jgi:dipeptidyl aminopeptidase/acylaminoacyl peptidase